MCAVLQVPNSIFATASVTEPSATSNYETASYKEVISGLTSLWEDQKREIEALTDVCFKAGVWVVYEINGTAF